MARAAHHQSAFLGGEWSPLSQGRSDLPAYKQAMNVCLNGMPIEEGAWIRRSGFQFIAPTRNRLIAKLLPFSFVNTYSFALECTSYCMRMFSGTSPLFTYRVPTVSTSSFASNLLTLGLSAVTGLYVGDDCMLWAPSTLDYAAIGPFRNRVMQIVAISGTNVTLGDETGAVFGAGVTSSADALVTCVLYQLVRIDTPWTGSTVLANLRAVQADTIGETNSIILSSSTMPYQLQIDSDITFGLFTLSDGPYKDPQADTGTVSGYTGSITFTPASTTFSATDVGRSIRLYSRPPAWASGTTYAYGDTVTYEGKFWKSIATGTYATVNVGVVPGTMATSGTTQVFVWAPAPQAASWAWGSITAQATTSCTVAISTTSADLHSANGATITSWRLGLYTSGSYPTCGAYHKGRLWLGGAIENRLDASSANDTANFSPTDQFGLVTDANAISETLNADDTNKMLWMKSDHQGLIVGTLAGEWLISASTLNDPFTPTSISADKVTKYGCANVEPSRIGMVLAFVQRFGQRVLEYLGADAFSNRFVGRHINERAKHITAAGVTEMAYQEEKAPVIWVRMTDGTLAGCTYRRTNRSGAEEPAFQGWHRQVIGGSYAGALVRPVSSMVVLPNDDGLSDLLYVATSDTALANGAIEVLRPLYEDA